MRLLLLLTLTLCAGCASYATPGGPAPLATMNAADAEAVAAARPTLSFPVSINLVRIQAADYESFSAERLAGGSFSVVAPAELAAPQALRAVAQWPLVSAVEVLRPALLPARLESLDDLRLAAAKNLADVLIVYTVDTRFESGGVGLAPRAELSLGKSPSPNAAVASTASALLIDVRTGYRYGMAQANARVDDLADAWMSAAALDRTRVDTERQAVIALLSEAQKIWNGIAGPGEFAHSLDSSWTAAR
ncbi:MAG: hypothetical protein WC809_13930 [Sinimarinibacterium sp.]